MRVMGICCEAKTGFSYAILEGNRSNPKTTEVGTHCLSEDLGMASPKQLDRICEKITDLAGIFKPEKVHYYTTKGAGPGTKQPDPFKYRMEGVILVTLYRNGIRTIEEKTTQKIASILGIKGSGQRERIRQKVKEKFHLTNNMEREAVAVALSALDAP